MGRHSGECCVFSRLNRKFCIKGNSRTIIKQALAEYKVGEQKDCLFGSVLY